MSKGWIRHKSRMTSFVALERFLLQSPAWRSLTPNARAAYIEIAHGYSGSNNGYVRMSALSLARQLHVGRSTAHRALLDLIAKGFIEVAQAGGFNMKSGPRASELRLTAFYCDRTNQKASKLFMKWHSEIQNTVPLQSNCGPATDQLSSKLGKNMNEIVLIRDHEARKQGVHGPTTEHHLEYNHMGRALQQGGSAALSEASATPCSSDSDLGTFKSLAGIVLQSLAQLDAQLPDSFKSWKPLQAPSRKILSAPTSIDTVEQAA